ncbi:hypothetical protein [Streptomyces anulatus]|uniref:hypothetical protein n=1 Tax=Streptomyces anulatus TaxID=1892 RepID=UPI002F90DC8D
MNSVVRLPGRIGPNAVLITAAAVPLTGWAVHAVTLYKQIAAKEKDPLTGLLRRYATPPAPASSSPATATARL